MNTFGLPENVYQKFFVCAIAWTLDRYIGDKFCINKDWKNRGKFGYINIFSVQVAENSGKGLRILRGLVRKGLLTEKKKDYPTQIVRFSIANKDHEDELLRRAYDYWRSFGYEAGVISERKHP